MKTLKFYRMPELKEITGLSPSGVYKLIRESRFPRGVKLTSRATGWLSHDVDRWLESRLDQGMPKTDQTRAAQVGLPQLPDSISPLQRRVEK